MNLISYCRQPAGVGTRATAGIDNRRGRRRQVAKNELPRARLFKLKPSCAQTRGFVSIGIMLSDFGKRVVWIGCIHGRESAIYRSPIIVSHPLSYFLHGWSTRAA